MQDAIDYIPSVIKAHRMLKFRAVRNIPQSTNKIFEKNFAESFYSLFLHSLKNKQVLISTSESSSFGRARPCQGRGGQFEPGLSLNKKIPLLRDFFSVAPVVELVDTQDLKSCDPQRS